MEINSTPEPMDTLSDDQLARKQKSAESRLKQIVWLSGGRSAKPIGEMTNVTLSGAAASFALAIASLKDGNVHVHDFEMHLLMVLLVLSVAFGVIAKYLRILASSEVANFEGLHG